jgi:hypothetical protein
LQSDKKSAAAPQQQQQQPPPRVLSSLCSCIMGITLIESAANNWKIVPMQQHYYGSIIIYLLLVS